MNNVFAVIGLLALAGCSTTGRGYKNPEFAAYQLESTAVSVMDDSEFGVELENKITAALNKRGVRTFATRDMARFSKSKSELLTKIWAKGAKDLMIVSYGDAGGEAGYQIVSTSWTQDGTAYASGSATQTSPLSRQMQMRAAVFTPTDDKVWEANTNKSARGLLFTGDGAMMSGSVDALIDALKKDKLIK